MSMLPAAVPDSVTEPRASAFWLTCVHVFVPLIVNVYEPRTITFFGLLDDAAVRSCDEVVNVDGSNRLNVAVSCIVSLALSVMTTGVSYEVDETVEIHEPQSVSEPPPMYTGAALVEA